MALGGALGKSFWRIFRGYFEGIRGGFRQMVSRNHSHKFTAELKKHLYVN